MSDAELEAKANEVAGYIWDLAETPMDASSTILTALHAVRDSGAPKPLPVSGETQGAGSLWPKDLTICSRCGTDLLSPGHNKECLDVLLKPWKRISQLEQELTTERAAREKREANPAVGTCVFCGSTIWHNEPQMIDERGMFHPICGVKARAESAELRIKAYLEAVTPEDAWAVVKARELSEDLDSRDYFDAGYKAAEARAGDVTKLREAVEHCLDSVNGQYGHTRNANEDSKYLLWLSQALNAALASVPAEPKVEKKGGVVEYDGAFFCTICGSNWGAISKPDKPCAHARKTEGAK